MKIAERKGSSDFYISHATLADVEAGSVPSIYKLFSLAVCLKMSYAETLLSFGVNPDEVELFKEEESAAVTILQPAGLLEKAEPFRLHFDVRTDTKETRILTGQPKSWGTLPAALLKRLAPRRFTYAVVGLQDDTMGDMIPPGALIEVDKEQNTVEVFVWHTLRQRPIYLVWHERGYTCSWCQQDGSELLLLPHPASRRSVMKLRLPREATVIGRVVHAWCSFQPTGGTTGSSVSKTLLP